MKTINGNDFDMDELKAKADGYIKSGYNCTQSVIRAIGPELGMDVDTACRATQGFGLGMGDMSEACGAISGGVVVLSYANNADAETPAGKKDTIQYSKQLVNGFRDMNTSSTCREIKGVDCNHPMLRSCPGCVEDCVELTVKLLQEM